MNVVDGKDETARTEKHRVCISRESERERERQREREDDSKHEREQMTRVKKVQSWSDRLELMATDRAGWNKKQGLGVGGGDGGRGTNITSCQNLRHLGREGPCRAPCRQGQHRWRGACRLAAYPSHWLESSSSHPCHLQRTRKSVRAETPHQAAPHHLWLCVSGPFCLVTQDDGSNLRAK